MWEGYWNADSRCRVSKTNFHGASLDKEIGERRKEKIGKKKKIVS